MNWFKWFLDMKMKCFYLSGALKVPKIANFDNFKSQNSHFDP